MHRLSGMYPNWSDLPPVAEFDLLFGRRRKRSANWSREGFGASATPAPRRLHVSIGGVHCGDSTRRFSSSYRTQRVGANSSTARPCARKRRPILPGGCAGVDSGGGTERRGEDRRHGLLRMVSVIIKRLIRIQLFVAPSSLRSVYNPLAHPVWHLA